MKTWGDFSKWKQSLKGLGVDIIEWDSSGKLILQCRQCQQRWSPNLGPDPHLRDNYWHCPNGCNTQEAPK